VEAEARLAAARPGLPVDRMVAIASAQAQVTRKYTVETLRGRAGMGGYVVTGLRDTPIATSGVFDDLGRPKGDPAAFRAWNADAILCLEAPRRRAWTHGGDRPSRIDRHCAWAGETASWVIVLDAPGQEAAPGPRAHGRTLRWRLTRGDGSMVASGGEPIRADANPCGPRMLTAIQCALPPSSTPQRLTLTARLEGDPAVENAWPVWSYPKPEALERDVRIFDPGSSFDEPVEGIPLGTRVASAGECPASSILVATAWNKDVHQFLVHGGKVLLWQQGPGAFPHARGPFWREAVKLLPEHPLWSSFPHDGHADMQFFGLATDAMLDGTRLAEAVPEATEVRHVMRRLDARAFVMHEYILEARAGAGALLATSLRLAGGQGAQPAGFGRNVAGCALYRAMVGYLTDLA
jgi:hypothetical protein